MNIKSWAMTALFASAASLAHAAQPVASLACTGTSASFNINLSYFNLGLTQSAPPSTAIVPLTLHAALGSFETLFASSATGQLIPSCTLSTRGSNGNNIVFTLKSVTVTTVTAAAGSATAFSSRTAYVKATLNYTAVEVTEAGGGADDGGASPVTVGYDPTQNKSS
ncbi:MAG TPA: hypothetical protein VHW71_07545 [Steroidobacteraceae bacterium]|nr:hypothetical protein [Steroidobacteraceae bacterium]